MIVLALGLIGLSIWSFIDEGEFTTHHAILFVFAIAFLAIGIAVPVSNSSIVNEEKYNELAYVYEHFDKLSAYEQKSANEDFKEWNKKLQDNNNLFIHFKTEDISEYIFEIKELKTQTE
jgi:hypothetical protein